ncbi:MAG: efflux RND transporter periplasmic adaptor subunit [Saprospiraceae bacterium]|nr:efflux RND transporter periplasmic adaptor subunit [Saprospiraceae bacterium]
MSLLRSILLILPILCLSASCSKKQQSPQDEILALKELVKKSNERINDLELIISKSDTNQRVIKSKKVTLDTLILQNFKHFIEAQGMVDAELNVLAAPQMPGVVKKILVKEGDYVRSGQTLAKLDANIIYQGIEELKTSIALAHTMYDKQKSLWEQNIGSEAQYLMAKNQKDQLEKKLATLHSQLDMTNIKSPVNGTIDEIKVRIGENAAPGFNGIRVVNNSKLKVKAKLSDIYIGKVKKGDKVTVYFPDIDKEIETTLNFTAQSVNTSSRTILIEAPLPGSNSFKANQTAKLKINDANYSNVITVNSNYIQRSVSGEDYILVAVNVDGQLRAKKRVIQTGSSYDGNIVVEKGLSKGDIIITTGYSEIVDGQAIQL